MKQFILIIYHFKSKLGKYIDLIWIEIINSKDGFPMEIAKPQVLLHVIDGATMKKLLFGITYHGTLYII